MSSNHAVMTQGFEELQQDIARMAKELDAENESGEITNRALQLAAVPVEAKMRQNASVDPKMISGALHDAIHTGKVRKRVSTGKKITIGVHRKDWNTEAEPEKEYYPAYVEYGHGGPAPAPSHPYIRPAYDTTEEEAYRIIRDTLRRGLDGIINTK